MRGGPRPHRNRVAPAAADRHGVRRAHRRLRADGARAPRRRRPAAVRVRLRDGVHSPARREGRGDRAREPDRLPGARRVPLAGGVRRRAAVRAVADGGSGIGLTGRRLCLPTFPADLAPVTLDGMGAFRVLVIGGRHFTNYPALRAALDALLVNRLPDVELLTAGGPLRSCPALGKFSRTLARCPPREGHMGLFSRLFGRREPAEPKPAPPVPGAEWIPTMPALVAQLRASGLPVRCCWVGLGDNPPEAAGCAVTYEMYGAVAIGVGWLGPTA